MRTSRLGRPVPIHRAPLKPVVLSVPQLLGLVPLFGAIDGASGFMALLHLPVAAWYGPTVAIKLLFLAWTRPSLVMPSGWTSLFVATTATMIVLTLLAGIVEPTPYFQAAGFLVEFLLTILILRHSDLPPYLLGATGTILASASIHAIMCVTHHMTVEWGRFDYFNGEHPNLGGEIAAAGSMAAVIALPRIPALAVIAVLFADSYLLQARAAMIAEVVSAAVPLMFNEARRLTPMRASILVLVGTSSALAMGVVGLSQNALGVGNLLMLTNDVHRGFATGFSGRTELWSIAIRLFQESPLLGHGFGYFDTIGYLGPHNIVLYGLAENGVASLGCFLAVAGAYTRLARRDLYAFAAAAAMLPLLIFNDRFINLNPYPFLLYVLLFAAYTNRRAAAPASGSKMAPTKTLTLTAPSPG
jgi:O-antigen ligase